MQKNIIIIFVMLFGLNVFAQQERGMRIITKDPQSGSELGIYNDLWAVVIGINKYQQWKQLHYAVKDAETVAEVLASKYGFQKDHVILLKDNEATLQGIKNALGAMISRAGEDDGVIFFFAGHGQTFKTRDGKEMGYLIPVDGNTEDENLYSTALAMSEVKNLSNLIPAKHILFLVDACYSGLAAASEYRGLLSPQTEGFLRKVSSAKTRHIITAGGAGEQVQENDEWGHSAFTYELINGLKRDQADLNNDRIITADELAEYLTSHVSRITGSAQLPQSRRLSIDEGKFVFIIREDTAQPDIQYQTVDIIQQSKNQLPRGFYLFYGFGRSVGYRHGRVYSNNIDKFFYTASMGFIFPAVGYKFNDNISLEVRVFLNTGIHFVPWLLEMKYNVLGSNWDPYGKIGLGIENYEKKGSHFPVTSLFIGLDHYFSMHFSAGLDAGFCAFTSDEYVYKSYSLHLLIRYHF